MHLVLDAVAVRTGSAAIVVRHLLAAWRQAYPDDRVSVLSGPGGPDFTLPDGVDLVVLPARGGPLGQVWLRSAATRRAARRLGADAVLSGVPASGLLGSRAPRGVILYDLRAELRPEQFSRRTRIARRLSWGWSLRRADHVLCISERTLDDLRTHHPRVARRARAATLGSDHALAWDASRAPGAADGRDGPYALAFGHYGNKNAAAVVAGWSAFCRDDDTWRLRLVGMGRADRAAADAQVEALGIAGRVEVMPWLDDDQFAAVFAGAGLVVFPSDFEGFGLPAAEALRLGIPTVVSADPALAEVTGGHAVTSRSTDAADLADAISAAIALTPAQREAGRIFAEDFTWARTARIVREALTS